MARAAELAAGNQQGRHDPGTSGRHATLNYSASQWAGKCCEMLPEQKMGNPVQTLLLLHGAPSQPSCAGGQGLRCAGFVS